MQPALLGPERQPRRLVHSRWQLVELSALLEDSRTLPAELTLNLAGQWILTEGKQRKKKSQITDIISWIQTYSRYIEVLMSCEATTKEEATGLVAHLHLIIQLSRDLGSQWQKIDRGFREWEAAISLRRWSELNFPIYGRCLAVQQRHPTPLWS